MKGAEEGSKRNAGWILSDGDWMESQEKRRTRIAEGFTTIAINIMVD